MLKLTYTEAGLHLERVATPLEAAIAQRAILALRLGQTLVVQPQCASLLLPADAAELVHLQTALRQDDSITPVDDEFVEVSFSGSWLTTSAEAEEGVLLTELGDRAEALLYKLWQYQTQTSSLTQ